MRRTSRLINFEDTIDEGYFSKLDSLVASRTWPPRVRDMKPQNIRREVDQIKVDIEEMKRWKDRIYDAIHSGVAKGVMYFSLIVSFIIPGVN